MKFPTAIFVYALPLLGVPLGYFGNSLLFSTSESDQAQHEMAGQPPETTSANSSIVADEFPRLVTGDTLESLVAQGDGVSYASVALWLLDADATEMAAFWENYRKGNPKGNVKRLLFINWTRLDPSAAIAATTGTDDEKLVWWAWAANDPATALASAPNVEMRNRVAQGAGEFDPAWVRENFESIPEDSQRAAINGIRTWKEDSDHAATLDFLLEYGGGHTGSIFKSFARKDPWAAYDWLEKNGKLKLSQYGRGGDVEVLIAQMKELHPDDLERMADMTPSGAIKWKMEDALFESLLATDPERALEKARKGKAPLVNAQRLAAIGSGLLFTDPEKAFDLGGEILAMSEGTLSPNIIIRHENGGSRQGVENQVAQGFVERLLAKDPYRTLDMAAVTMADSNSKIFATLSSTAAEKDLNGYAAWVNRQTDAETIKKGTGVVVSGLARKGNFTEASEWAMNDYEPKGELPNGMLSLAYQWARKDHQGAGEWLESTPLSDNHRASLRSIIRSYSK